MEADERRGEKDGVMTRSTDPLSATLASSYLISLRLFNIDSLEPLWITLGALYNCVSV